MSGGGNLQDPNEIQDIQDEDIVLKSGQVIKCRQALEDKTLDEFSRKLIESRRILEDAIKFGFNSDQIKMHRNQPNQHLKRNSSLLKAIHQGKKIRTTAVVAKKTQWNLINFKNIPEAASYIKRFNSAWQRHKAATAAANQPTD